MKNFYTLLTLLAVCLLPLSEIQAQGTEDFESETTGATTFTENGQAFTITNGPGESTYDIEFFATGGWNGTSTDDKFIDNSNGLPIQNDGTSFTITTTDGADISVTSLYIFIATRSLLNPTSELTITGKKNGGTEYTITKSSGFSNVQTFSPNNGFTLIDFATAGAADYSTTKVDELIFSTTFNGDYIALDNFIFDFEIVEMDPPQVQSIAVVGSPISTATTVDFLVTFNEDALNVDTSDFVLDAVGTSGVISGISGTGSTYTVTVSTISGEGAISIDLGANDITDSLGNGTAPAFTAGEAHTVSRCFQETFEGFTDGDVMFSSNGVGFTTGTVNFKVDNFPGGGAGSSDQFLCNIDDTGISKKYSITTPGTELFNVEALDVFLSSIAAATDPTNDGSIILRGKLTGATLYTITKNSGFPIDFSINNGFTTINFDTAGASDYSLTNIDELEIELGGAFVYIALDNFEHCEEVTTAAPPIVQSIKLVGNPLADAATVDFEVIFNENAVNVSMDDFSVNATGTAVGTIASITGSGNTYVVTVNTISGEGSIRLDLNPGTNIADGDGNTTPDPFTMGEVHLVSDCNVETFESLAIAANTWTTDIHPFTTNPTSLKVDEFIGAGAGGSDQYLDNITDQGLGKVYSIAITDTNSMFMNSMEIFVTSILDGANPTDDGTLTIVGKLDGVTEFTVIKSTGFPTIFGTTNGFFTWDFATEGGIDNSEVIVDELVFTLGGAFEYIAIDNFKFCDVCDPPVADILTNVSACESYELLPLSAGNQYFTETGGAGTELVAGGTVTSTQNIFVYAAATAPCAADETEFMVTINPLPAAPTGDASQTACDDGSGGSGDYDFTYGADQLWSGSYATMPETTPGFNYFHIELSSGFANEISAYGNGSLSCEALLTDPGAPNSNGSIAYLPDGQSVTLTNDSATDVFIRYLDPTEGSGDFVCNGIGAIDFTLLPGQSVTLLRTGATVAPVSGGTATATATAPAGSSVVWYDAATLGNVVDPEQVGVGTSTFWAASVDDTTNCESATRLEVTLEVFALPTVAFTAPADLCLSAGVQTGLGGGTPTGGIYSGMGVTDSGDGETYSFDPGGGRRNAYINLYLNRYQWL